ncbi:MAG: LamG domain-containing protein [Thermoguttaceae bacterium]|nr:LamG domain-containing protein [Thermoguttaceae bacterium]
MSTLGLIDWFDPDIGLTLDPTGYVTGWANQAVGNNVTVADPETSVVAGPNGTGMIRFANPENGAGLRYNQSGILTTGYTLFAVVRLNEPISGMNSYPRFVRTTNDYQVFFLNKSNGQVTVKATPISNRPVAPYSSTYALGDGVGGLGDVAILAARLELDRQALYFNGRLVSEKSNTPVSYDFGTGTIWEIGNSVKGDIGSVLVYDNSLTEAGFQSTGAALAAQYGTFWGLERPVVHWKFDGNDGNVANSGTGGSQYNGNLVEGDLGSYEYVASAPTNSQSLSLNSDPITGTEGAHVGSTYVPRDSGTVALWYNPGSFYNFNTIFDNSVSGNDWEMWIGDSGVVNFRTNSNSSDHVSYNLNNLGGADEWHHLAVTWERQADNPSAVATQLYVAGQLRASNTGTWTNPGNFLLGGGNSGNTYGTGTWDDVRIYERVLSGQEVFGLSWVRPTQPVVHWRMNGNLANSGSGGSQYDGSIANSGNYEYVDGRFCNNEGLHLDGAYVESGYTPADSGTVALWYHAAESFYNYETIFDNSVNANHWEFWIDQSGSARFRVNSAGPTVAYNLNSLEGPDNWYHMAVTWERLPSSDPENPDQVAVQLYVDGIRRQSGTGTWIDPGELFLGGGHSGNTFGRGIWDDVRIYDRVLSGYEIAALMVPEPSALIMLAPLVFGLALRRRRRYAQGLNGYNYQVPAGGASVSTFSVVRCVSSVAAPTVMLLVFAGAAVASPVLHWRLDGNVVNSGTGGSQYDGTLVQGATGGYEYMAGAHALTQQGLSLTNNRVNSGGTYVSSSYVPQNSGTIALWYKPGEYYNFNTIFDNSVTADDWEMWIPNTGTATFRINRDGTARLEQSLNQPGWTPNDWYHFAVTWDRHDGDPNLVDSRLYVNGVLRQDKTGNWIAPGNFLLGGGSNGNMYGDGVWDDVRIYERALAGHEISALSRAVTQPVVHWKFNGDLTNSGSGGSQYDGVFVGTGQHAYVDGACCATGQGLSLAANPQSQSTGGTHVDSNYVPGDSGTIAMWYKPTDFYNYQSIFDNGTSSSEEWEFWIYSTGVARFRTRGEAVSFDLDNLEGANHWYHMAVTWDRQDADPTKADIQLYIDGVLRDSNVSTWVDPSNVYLAGGHPSNNYGRGVWDDVRIFDRVLSAHEISSLMIPEPSTPVMLAFAVPLLTLLRRRNIQGTDRAGNMHVYRPCC